MEERLPGGTKVAIVSVASPSTAFSSYVIDSLEAALVDKGTVKVVDRANLEKIRAEQGFQLSGEVSDASAKAIGQLLGAGAIVTGSLLNIGSSYRLTLKAINIESAEVAVSYPADIANDERVQSLLASGSGFSVTPVASTGNRPTAGIPPASSGGGSNAAPSRPAVAPAPAGVTKDGYVPGEKGPAGGIVFYPAVQRENAPVTQDFKVGDRGPAGGIIFYMNPRAGEWKYLEAAPASTEETVKWGGQGTEVGRTTVAMGGKRTLR
jgi:hypothetical protein